MISLLSLSLQGNWDTMVVGKNVVRTLNSPKFVSIRVNSDYTSIAVLPCDSKDVMSFSVPENLFDNKNTKCRIYSKGFIRDVLSKNNLDSSCTYIVHGEYSESQNAVIFHIKDGKKANTKGKEDN